MKDNLVNDIMGYLSAKDVVIYRLQSEKKDLKELLKECRKWIKKANDIHSVDTIKKIDKLLSK